MSKLTGACIEPVKTNVWVMSGPWCAIIIEREEAGARVEWTTRVEREELRLYRGRCEGALADAYSRVMGFNSGGQ